MKIWISYVCLLGILLSSFGALAQYKPKNSKKQFYGNQRLHQPLYRWVNGNYSRHGIQFQFGPTYTFTPRGSEEGELQLSADTLLRYNQKASGRIGIFGEIGMVHITKRPRKFIHYYDWGLGYKHYGGTETFEAGVYDNRDTLIGNVDGQGKFYNGYLFGRFSVHNVFQMSPYTFLDNALGVNLDYALLGKNMAYDGYHDPSTQQFQGDILGQLHYNFGYGFRPKVDKGFFIIPGFRLPVLGIYEWNGGTPAIHWFSSKYYPAMFKVKFVWLFKKDPNRCPPVEINEDDRKRANEYMNR
ncbi:MAG: hypothetical protein R3277_11800 [Brumimicrobium sp.]|nr:hypothetical protein [Brumimicrobium sp.]